MLRDPVKHVAYSVSYWLKIGTVLWWLLNPHYSTVVHYVRRLLHTSSGRHSVFPHCRRRAMRRFYNNITRIQVSITCRSNFWSVVRPSPSHGHGVRVAWRLRMTGCCQCGTLSLQLFECVPVMILSVINLKPTTSSRPSNPLSASIRAPQIWPCLTIVRVYKLYLLT